MIKTVLGLSLVFALSAAALAQKVDSKSSSSATNTTTASKAGKDISFVSGTQIAADLQNSLNVQRSKVGDEVILKTRKAVKQNGKVVVAKGSQLIGRVTEVQEKTKMMASSKIGVLFHTLVQNGQSTPITAMITSITKASAYASTDDNTFASSSASSSTGASTQTSSSGGLLGGVGNTVGGVVNATTSTVVDVAKTTGQVVGATATTVGRATGIVSSNIRGLQISQSADASASGGSTLTLSGGNLKLEKGTTFNLNVSESASAGSTQDKQPEK